MPSQSPAQHRLFELVAHDPAAAHRLGIPQSVGREFVEADKGHHFASGGTAGFAHLPLPHFSPGVHVMARGFPHASGAFHHPALADGGSPMGISGGAADPWWTRAEARGADVHPGGLIGGLTAGRADHVPTAVAADSYILPADVVSGLGEGNTLNGAAVIDKMLHSEPYGIAPPRLSARRMPMPEAHAPAFHYADGGLSGFAEGRVPHGQGIVPVRLSGGEYVVLPQFVEAIGHGDIDRGHNILDAFVKMQRAKHIKKLKSLPGPKRSD